MADHHHNRQKPVQKRSFGEDSATQHSADSPEEDCNFRGSATIASLSSPDSSLQSRSLMCMGSSVNDFPRRSSHTQNGSAERLTASFSIPHTGTSSHPASMSSGPHSHRASVLVSLNAQGRKRLDEMTINKLKFDRVGLVGRSKEVQEIKQLFPLGETKRLLLVGGAAGTGKSSLVQHTLQPLLQQYRHNNDHPTSTGGFLLRGKHLQQGDKPYAGVTACCEDLSHQIVAAYSRAQLEDLQEQLQAELGLEASVLTSVIPGLLPIIGLQEEEEEEEEGQESSDGNEKGEDDDNNSLSTEEAGAIDSSSHNDSNYASLLLNWKNHRSINNWSQRSIRSNTNGTSMRGSFTEKNNASSNLSFSAIGNDLGGKYLEARLRFNNAFRRFLRILCRHADPVVFVIDDLHWCDEPSFQLFEHLLKDREKIGFLIVGTFRPAEVHEKHALTRFRKRLQVVEKRNPHLQLSYIPLGNLERDALLDMLVELLSTTPCKALPLAECILHKTNGNAFFIVQFLTILQQRELLSFNFGTLTWTWDLEQIDQGTEATDNVADLVRSKMEILSAHLQSVLPLLGSLGSVFGKDLFEMVMDHVRNGTTSDANTAELWQEMEVTPTDDEILNACVDEGLIEAFGDASYRWIHDKVEEAALALVPEDQLGEIQFDLASTLFELMNEQQVAQNIFVLVYLFRMSNEILPPNDPLREIIARLRLESGLQAFRGAAYDQAVVELHKGIELLKLNEDSWETEYELCLHLYSTAAEANLCIGELDAVEECVSTLLHETEGKPLLHRRRGYNALVRSYLADGRFQKACDLLLDVLAQLGIKFGKLAAAVKIMTKLVRVKNNASKNTFAISNLPPMTDEKKSWTIFLLDRLAVTWYQLRSPLLPLAVLTSLERTLEGGIMEISPNVIASAGFLCAIGLQDYQAAKLYALEALNLVKGMTSKYSEAQTSALAYHFALIHTMPVEDLRKGLLQGYEAGMESGDSEFGCWCINHYIEQTFASGVALESVIQLAADHTREAQDLNQRPSASLVSLVWQAALNLAGRSEDPLVFSGEAITEEEWLANDFGISHWRMHYVRYKIHLAVLFGEYDAALDWILKEKVHQGTMDKAYPGAYTNCFINFHCAIASISMARKVQKRSRFYRTLARNFGSSINTLTDKGSPNVKHYNNLLTAELADMKGDTENANEWFQKAIALSARRGFLLDRAFAHERYGDFYLRQNDVSSAKYQYSRSIAVYRDWGATAKAQQLEQQYFDLLRSTSTLVIAFPPTIEES